MRAGSLTQFCDIYRLVNQQTTSGAMSKVRTLVASIRCTLVKQAGSYVQYRYEEGDKVNLVFQTWLNTTILDTDTLCWNCQEFKITLLEYNYQDRTMRIYCQKINK